jgi:hypothetical protein
MVRHPRDDRWSSFRAHADGRTDPLVSDHPVYRALGRGAEARQSAYRALFRGALESGFVNALRAATNGGWACAAMIDNYRCNKRALRRNRFVILQVEFARVDWLPARDAHALDQEGVSSDNCVVIERY